MARYEALTNLSVSRVKDKMADMVHRGEIVELEDEIAQRFLHGHRVPMVRPASEKNDPAPVITARDMFGPQPVPPAGAEPDPAGASQIVVTEAEKAPEANDPKADTGRSKKA